MPQRLFRTTLILANLFVATLILGQKANYSILPKVQEKEMDAHAEQWNSTQTPGVAVLIMNKGKLVYRKCFGMANVEKGIPISPSTKFPLAEISAHFTAFATLMMAERSKLSLNDKISSILPDLPKIYKDITVGNLLHHASGIDDYERLKTFAGWKSTDLFTHQDALQIVKSQQELLFEPGTKISFSQTNLVLLSEVLSKVSGKPFNIFMQDEIFTPLDMHNTLVAADALQIIEDGALSYQVVDDQLKSKPVVTSILGNQNIYTTLEDLVKWENHQSNPSLVNDKIIDKMNAIIEFDNEGKTIATNDGITLGQIGYHPERGAYKWWMNGSTGGYSSCVTKIVDKGFVSYVLSNSGEAYTGYISVIAAGKLNPEYFPLPAQFDYSKVKTLKLTEAELNKYTGIYWNPEAGLSRELIVRNDTLRYSRTNGSSSPLIPISKNKFQMVLRGDDQLVLNFHKHGAKQFSLGSPNDTEPLQFEAYTPTSKGTSELEAYTGYYLNPELGIVYETTLEEGHLILKINHSSRIQLAPIMADTFSGNNYSFSNINFERNGKSSVQGLTIKSEGKDYLYFNKVILQ